VWLKKNTAVVINIFLEVLLQLGSVVPEDKLICSFSKILDSSLVSETCVFSFLLTNTLMPEMVTLLVMFQGRRL